MARFTADANTGRRCSSSMLSSTPVPWSRTCWEGGGGHRGGAGGSACKMVFPPNAYVAYFVIAIPSLLSLLSLRRIIDKGKFKDR